MADTCIVCLNDLGGDAVSSPVAAESPPRPDNDNDNDDDPGVNLTPKASLPQQSIENADAPGATQRLARLVPCLHMFHNECLKPWVERANSCPVCRASFNVVELLDTVGGPVLSTYTVQDRVQVADIDPFMIFEEEVTDDSDTQPCPFCGDNDNEEVLLLCDGCDVPSHTYCLGLDAVPSGSWYCDACETQRAISAVSDAPSRPPRSRRPERRTRAQQRLLRNHNQANSLQWAAVWQSVYDRLNLDLDFPFDDEQQLPRPHGRVTLRRGSHRAWQRRLEVAERQGVGRVFREPSAIIDEYVPRPSRPRVPRAPTPQPESLEEMRAWNAFERARELENDPSAARKRKEPTLSPSPEPTEPERKLKRPRTRRTEELAALATQNSHGEPSRSAARLNADSGGGPSFLQSLLKEVEDASNSPRTDTNGPPTYMNTPNDFHSSPGPSSPSLSPASSSPSSPRLSSRSPPPHSRIRAVSPMQLPPSIDSPSSPPPEFSPSISPAQSQIDNSELRRRPDSRHQDRPGQRRAGSTRSNDVSPSRLSLSLSAKTNIQKLVSSELKPYYRRKIISKDDYTNINRTVSRKLYEHVEEGIELQEDHLRELKDSARKAVKEAVDLIRDKPSSTDEKTDSGNALIGVN